MFRGICCGRLGVRQSIEEMLSVPAKLLQTLLDFRLHRSLQLLDVIQHCIAPS